MVDDGSTDRTQEVCVGFKERVRYVYQKNDGTMGAGAARAILESRGEWVALLDHDDRWLSTKIEEQLAEIQHDERTGIVFTGVHIIDETGRLTGEELPKGPSGDVFHHLLEGADTALPRLWSDGPRSTSQDVTGHRAISWSTRSLGIPTPISL